MFPVTAENREVMDCILEAYQNDKTHLVPILQEIQDLNPYHYIPFETANIVAERLNLPLVCISSVISFYASLSDKPKGLNVIQVCKSTSCLIGGYPSLLQLLENTLGIQVGETTPDRLFSLEYTNCIGACDLAPAIRINRQVYGKLDQAGVLLLLDHYRRKTR